MQISKKSAISSISLEAISFLNNFSPENLGESHIPQRSNDLLPLLIFPGEFLALGQKFPHIFLSWGTLL